MSRSGRRRCAQWLSCRASTGSWAARVRCCWRGIGLLLVGTVGLAVVDPRTEVPTGELGERPPRFPSGTNGLDTRVTALLARLEALGEDGLDPITLQALAHARAGALLGLPAVEDSAHAAALDDGARFVVLALADADPAAIHLVPTDSHCAVAARTAVAAWWDEQTAHVPRIVRTELDGVLTAIARGGGIQDAGPVD